MSEPWTSSLACPACGCRDFQVGYGHVPSASLRCAECGLHFLVTNPAGRPPGAFPRGFWMRYRSWHQRAARRAGDGGR